MCDKAVDNYFQALEFGTDCYKTQELCNKAVDTHPSTMQFVPESQETQKMSDKSADACHFVSDSVGD